MNYKYIIIIFVLLQFLLIDVTSAKSMDSLFDKDNKTLIIKNSVTKIRLLTIQQVSVKPDLTTMEETFKITSHLDYTLNKNQDFNLRWQKIKGKKDITNLKWEILENVEYNVTVPDYMEVEKNLTISNILSYTDVTDVFDSNPQRLDQGEHHAKTKWNVTSKSGTVTIGFENYEVITANPLTIKFYWIRTEYIGTHTEARYRDEWRPFSPEGKTIKKDESLTVKLTLYKQAESGSFSIKTIPMFAGVEEERLTWWNGSWNYNVDNTVSDSIRPYQFSLNISNSTGTNNATDVFLNGHANINFTDIRFTLDNTTALSYWIENSTTGKVWVNVSANGTVNMYYGNPSATDSSDGKNTFEFFDDFTNSNFGSNPVLLPTQTWESGESGGKLRWGSIAYLDGTYYIYYTNGSSGLSHIGRATSTDLKNWTKYANNPVILNRIGPSLLKELDGKTPVFYNNKYWMLTMKADGTAIELRSAPSLDSNTWTLENTNLITKAPGTWYENYLFTTSFVRENGTYHIFLEARNNSQYWNIGLFTASSPTGSYIDQGVLLRPDLSWEGKGVIDPEARKFGNIYYIFYTGNLTQSTYNNSYATSSSIYGPYIKSQIQVTPLGHTYPPVLFKENYYYILTDNQYTLGKSLFKRQNLNGIFGSPFDWDKGGSPTISESELLINADREYIRSTSAFLYKAMKIRAKFAPESADNSYQYMGFTASNIGDDKNSLKFESSDGNLIATSGNSTIYESTSVYDGAYFGSYHNYESLWEEGKAKFIIDDVLKATKTTYVADTPQPIGIYNYATNADFYVDWVFVRNYVSPEPAWAAWTIEHIVNAPSITSWGNNKTNSTSLILTINTSEAVKFNVTDDKDQTITTWNWYKDDINQNNNFDNFTTSWSSGGAKTIKANATDINGSSNTITWTITVVPPPAPAITSWGNNITNNESLALTINTSEAVKFNATTNQTITTWNWYKDDINQNNNFDNFTTSWSSDGTKTIKVNATNNNGTSDTIIWSVNVNTESPSISFTDPTPANSAILNQNYAYINTTVSDFSTALIDWNRSLVRWWRFNNESGENSAFFRDWSSWENNGTCSGTSCPTSISGKFGNALSFDGSNDYLSAGNIASGASGTMETWIKPNVYTGTQYVIGGLSSNGADINARYDIFVRNTGNCSSGDWGTIIANGITMQTVCSGQVYNYANFPAGTWKHIAVTYNGSVVSFYNDGVLIKTTAQTVSGAGNAQPFSIGRIGAYAGLYFNGGIDEVRIHSRALSSDEIKASYNAGIYRLYGNFTGLANGDYSYKAYAQNLLGNVNQTETRTLTLTAMTIPGAPSIIGSDPSSPVSDSTGATRSFNITVNQTVNVTWSINGTPVQSNNSVTSANYTNISSSSGTWLVNATATNNNGTVSREWTWIVTSPPVPAAPSIIGSSPSSPVSDSTGMTRSFNITVNQTVNVSWFINGTPVQSNNSVTSANYTNTSSSSGTWNVSAIATNSNGTVSREWTWIVTSPPVPAAPSIIGSGPSSPVSDSTGATRSFNITVNQTVNVSWYLNGTLVQSDSSVTFANYTNTSAFKGTWNVSATATNSNGTVSKEWAWTVSSLITAPSISFTDPTPANGAILNQNYAYINTTVSDSSTAFIDWNRSLVRWWRFNNESGENSAFFRDWSSWENNGTCSGTSCPTSTFGKFGNALSFDGSNDYLSAGNIASSTSGTMEAWIKPNSYTGIQYLMGGISSNGADINARYDIFVRNTGNCPSGDWGTIIANGVTSQTSCSGQVYNSANFPSGTWKHIAVTYNGSVVNFYNNGILIKTTAQTASGAGNAQPFSIGRIGAYAGLYFNGGIDEVRIHSRALSSDEIKASYNSEIYRLYGNFTNLTNGDYSYRAYGQNMSGIVNQTEIRALTVDVIS